MQRAVIMIIPFPIIGSQLKEGSPLSVPSCVVSPKAAAFANVIACLSFLETAYLKRALKKHNADQPVVPDDAMFPAHSPNSLPTEAEGDSSLDILQRITYSVMLVKFGDSKKIALIKKIQATIPGLSFLHAKQLVESAPVVVREDMGKAKAEEMKVALESAGAAVKII